MRLFCLSICLLSCSFLSAQNLYYPPLLSENWETVSPDSLGWCEDQIDSLINFLDETNSHSFIILHKGRIAIEHYFGDFGRDSLWYWASSGKSLMAFLVGMAQEEGLLNIDDSTSHYLGTGWTNVPLDMEGDITLRHQLSMTTGLDDGVPDPDCLDDSCLVFLSPPGSRWAYHNAPYRLLQEVVENASGQSLNLFTFSRLHNRIGMKGFWFNYVRYGRARDMARFGLLMLGRGVWNQDVLMSDTSYFQSMIHSSQTLNPSYGYLWWLNGQGSYMLPTLQLQFPTDLIPSAPEDCYAALGKNDQKIYVVPSLDLVVVRQGEASGQSLFALSSFDNQLWEHLNAVFCTNATANEALSANSEWRIWPNPAEDILHLEGETSLKVESYLYIRNLMGQLVGRHKLSPENLASQISLAHLPPGIYTLEGEINGQLFRERFVRR